MQTVTKTAIEVDVQRQLPFEALRHHWPEYLCEAAELGLSMLAACIAGVLLEHPASFLNQAIDSPIARRVLSGLAMGATAVAIIKSPIGQRSGAHFNPAFTLSFYMLGKVRRWDAVFYVLAQFVGAVVGVAGASVLVGAALMHSSVLYVVTVPGMVGTGAAFAAEALISGVLMMTVLLATNTARWAHLTPYAAGFLVAIYIAIESPISGMSMNPARTVGSAVFANVWTALWIYFAAPLSGMLVASFLYTKIRGGHRVFCAKLHHHNRKRCIFRCNHAALGADQSWLEGKTCRTVTMM